MQVFNNHKQGEVTKSNGYVIPIVYRIERSWTKGHETLILHNINAGSKLSRGLEAIEVLLEWLLDGQVNNYTVDNGKYFTYYNLLF